MRALCAFRSHINGASGMPVERVIADAPSAWSDVAVIQADSIPPPPAAPSVFIMPECGIIAAAGGGGGGIIGDGGGGRGGAGWGIIGLFCFIMCVVTVWAMAASAMMMRSTVKAIMARF